MGYAQPGQRLAVEDARDGHEAAGVGGGEVLAVAREGQGGHSPVVEHVDLRSPVSARADVDATSGGGGDQAIVR